MTWGSNATHDIIRCPYCGLMMRDDRDDGPATHMITCSKRPWWRRLFRPAPTDKAEG
jgi:hypothetical protein